MASHTSAPAGSRGLQRSTWPLPGSSIADRPRRIGWNIDDCIEFSGAVLLALVLAALVLAVV